MTTPLENSETSVRAGLEVSLEKAAGALTPEQQAAKRIQEEMNKTTPRTTLEALKAGGEIDIAKLNETLDSSFGKIDYGTGARSRAPGTPEAVLFARAATATDKVVRAIQEGYDKLPPPEQTDARNAIEKVINMHPDGAALLTGLGAGKQAFLENLLKDPQYIASLKTILAESFKPEKLPNDVDVKLQGEVEKAKKLKDAKERVRKEINDPAAGELPNLKKELNEFRGRAVGKGLELKTAEDDVDKYEKEVEVAKGKVETTLWEIQAGTTAAVKVAAQARLSGERGDLATKEAEHKKASRKVEALIGEKNTLPERISQLQAQLDKVEAEEIEAGYQFALANANLAAAESSKKLQEKAMTEGLEKAFEEGMRKFITDRVTTAEHSRVTLVGEEKTKADAAKRTAEEKATAAARQIVQDRLEDRYYRRVNRSRLRRGLNRRLDKGAVNSDYGTLLHSGPDQLLDRLLATVPMAARTPEYMNYISDPANRAELQGKLVAQMLAKKLEFSKISEHDAQYIASTTWGKEAISKAIVERTEFNGKIQQLKNEGGVKVHTIDQIFQWCKDNGKWGILILALFGLGGIATNYIIGHGGLMHVGTAAGAKIATGAKSLAFGKDITNAAATEGVSAAWTAQVAAEKHISPVAAAKLVKAAAK